MKKFALITGASRGIGKAVSLKLASMGYNILLNYVSSDDKANEVKQELEELGVLCELLKFNVASFEETQSTLGTWINNNEEKATIEVVVNNAGIRKDGLFLWMEKEQWDSVMGISLDGFFNVTKLCIDSMIKQKFGRVINMVSYSGLRGVAGQTNYSAARSAVIGATRSLAQEVGRRKITVNAVAPGFISTDMTEDLDEKALKKSIPLNRFGSAEEVANVVGFLASEQASYVTGETISVTGGL